MNAWGGFLLGVFCTISALAAMRAWVAWIDYKVARKREQSRQEQAQGPEGGVWRQ